MLYCAEQLYMESCLLDWFVSLIFNFHLLHIFLAVFFPGGGLRSIKFCLWIQIPEKPLSNMPSLSIFFIYLYSFPFSRNQRLMSSWYSPGIWINSVNFSYLFEYFSLVPNSFLQVHSHFYSKFVIAHNVMICFSVYIVWTYSVNWKMSGYPLVINAIKSTISNVYFLWQSLRTNCRVNRRILRYAEGFEVSFS